MNETKQVGKITQLTTSPCDIRNWPNVQELQRELAAATAELAMWRNGELNSEAHRETQDRLAAVKKERDDLRAAVGERDLNLSAHLNHCYEIEVKLEAVTKERDELKEAVRKRDDIITQIMDRAAAIANGDCPPWKSGDEPDECPDHECVKCWQNWVDGELKQKAGEG